MADEVALWKQLILERKASGQTITQWCRKHNVTKGSYHYWRRQVMKAESSAGEHTLKYLLTEMPNNAHMEHPEVIDQYLPWSKELPEECRLEHKYKKCFKK